MEKPLTPRSAGDVAQVKNFLLTGSPGVGKTTIIEKIIEMGLPVAGGFTTSEIRQGGRRLGFRVTPLPPRAALPGSRTTSGILAHVGSKGRHRVGKYGVNVDEFEAIGVAALESARERKGWIVIDEMGRMELYSARFRKVVREILDGPTPALGVIQARRDPFLDAIRAGKRTRTIEVTLRNRDVLPAQLFELLQHITHGTRVQSECRLSPGGSPDASGCRPCRAR
jgi:nucleoside-triphosphatase THEP1